MYIKILFPTTKSPLPKLRLQPLLRSFPIWSYSFTQGSSCIGRIPDRGNMNVRGNILIIWQGGSPISKHPHFDTQSPSPLPAFPPCPPASLPSSYPPVSSSHLTPSVSQGPIKSPLPPSPQHLSFSPSLSLKCHLHFSVHILTVEFPADGLIFLAIAATSAAHCARCGGG